MPALPRGRVKYLQAMPQLPVKFITVIHQIDGWVVNIKMNRRENFVRRAYRQMLVKGIRTGDVAAVAYPRMTQ